MNIIKRLYFLFICALLFVNTYGQNVHLSGFVKDKSTSEVLIGASVYDSVTNNAVYTDESGRFDIFVSTNSNVEVSYVGYELFKIHNTQIQHDSTYIILLQPSNTIETISVYAQKAFEANTIELSQAELKNTPSLGAKPDVLKTAQLLPGIEAQNEGASLLSVRGGDPGQNMFIIDNVPLIYVNHLGGFNSVFNPDIINNLTVYKGGFPPEFGGKLSSVFDITQRKGNTNKHQGNYSVGLTDLSCVFEGPMKWKNSSYIITARKTVLPDLFLLASSSLISENNSRVFYGYHDFNSKFTWELNSKHSLSLQAYQGDDYLHYFGKNDVDNVHLNHTWGNVLAGVHLHSRFGNKISATQSLSYTRYRAKNGQKYSTTLDSNNVVKIIDKSVKSELLFQSHWKYVPKKYYQIHFGVQLNNEVSIPNYYYNSTYNSQIESLQQSQFNESIYFDNIFRIKNVVQFYAGCRIESTNTSFDNIQIQPRLRLDVHVNKKNIFSLTYIEVYQNSHLLFTPGSIMSNEVWVPSDDYIPAAFSKQYSATYRAILLNNKYSFESTVFYKEMSNLVEFKDGYQQITGDAFWRDKLALHGVGNTQGAEFLLRKNVGNVTGFLSYTYSTSTRQFNNINYGKEYVFSYDRPHSLSCNISYKATEKITFAATWVYQTGLPYTPVIGRQRAISTENNNEYYEALIYGERNSARMRDYHRLDLGMIYKTTSKKGNSAEWTFSVYNVYSRKNPYFYYYNETDAGEFYDEEWISTFGYNKLKLYQISFFPIIPSFSYKVYFDSHKPTLHFKTNNSKTFKERFKSWLYYE